MDVYVYDKNLDLVGIIDGYKSLIWANRYWDVGDSELYCPADQLDKIQMGYYLAIEGSEMICKINKIELDTSAEEGNYLVVTGIDAKSYLDQRVVWNTLSADGNAELFVRKMVNTALGVASDERKLKKPNGERLFYLGDVAGLSEALTEQISYKNIGEKTREICVKFGWGYKVTYNNGKLYFSLYKGENRANSVIFSNDYENLASSVYVNDQSNMGNVALVAGEGEGASRERAICGEYSGTERYEVYVDAKDVSKTITYSDLLELYPNGIVQGNFYIVTDLEIQIIDADHLASLRDEYPSGSVVIIDGISYYRIPSAIVADLPSTPEEQGEVTLRSVIYETYLKTRGYQSLSEYGVITSFDGIIEPNTTFIYGQDYNLGDIVTVQTDYVTSQARIVEIIEVWDENGYSVEPKFEYITEV